ncbi:MAG: ribonuclease P protein subunit [Candidatus Altiarchaeota archaeon]
MISPYNILRHELVGLPLKVRVGGKTFEGVVEEETKNTFKLKTPSGVKTVVKESSVLEFRLPSGAVVEAEGELLSERPEDRIKRKHRIRF